MNSTDINKANNQLLSEPNTLNIQKNTTYDV